MTTSILALLGISALAAVKRIECFQYEATYKKIMALCGQVSELTTDKEEKDAMAETLATCISTLEQSNRYLSVLRNIVSVKQCKRR